MVETFQSLPFFYKERKNGIIHMRNNIRIYEVKSEYIKYLNNYQKHIFTQAQEKNRIRKNAEIVYSHKKHNGVSTPLAKRTNNFELLDQLHILIIGHCLAAHTFQMICVELTVNHHKSPLLKKFCQKNKCYLGTILNVCEHALSEKTFTQTYAVKSTGKLAVYIGLKA